jgi:glutathione S-transferase
MTSGDALTLHHDDHGEDGYKVRLLLAFLEIPHRRQQLDIYPGQDHRSDAFMALNPLGSRPVLVGDDFVLRDSHAILQYLAAGHDSAGLWSPRTPALAMARIAMWLGFARELTTAVSAARRHDTLLETSLDAGAARADAHRLLRVLDEHLWFAEQEDQAWLCAQDHPTIADIACFAPTILCEEGGVSRLTYPAIRRWLDRFKRLPRFTAMAGVFGA